MRGSLITLLLLGLAGTALALPTKMELRRKMSGDDDDDHGSGDDHDEHAGHDHSEEEEEIEVTMTLSGEVADYGTTEVTAIQTIFVTLLGTTIEGADDVTVAISAASVKLTVEIKTHDAEHVEEELATVLSTAAAATTFIQTAVAGATVEDVPVVVHHEHEEEAAPCFPSRAMVTLANGKSSRIDALKEGDSIVAADADGKLTTDTVSILSLAKPSASSEFVTLTTASGAELSLTKTHHVPFGAACCSMLKLAKDVKVGDKIWVASSTATVAEAVTAKSTVTLDGLHSPILTNGGYPIVDKVVTAFDDAQTVSLAGATLKYLLPLCKATGSCNLFRRTFLNADRQYIDEA